MNRLLLLTAISATGFAIGPALAAAAPDVSAETATNIAIAAIVFAAGSEIIALLPIKSNSWVQLILQIGKVFFAGRR
jgi:hypothetical protein